MKKICRFIICTVISIVFLLAGCGPKQQAEPVGQICLTGAYKRQAMDAAQECLSKMHFTIDKADIEQGYIRTRPLTGAQWFEFWRSDNVGSFNKAEANIQDIRRKAELNIGPLDDKLCINCVVTVQRLSLPGRRAVSSAHAYNIFTESGEGEQRSESSPGRKKTAEWLDLGRDNALETEILNRIENQITELREEK